MKRTWALRSQIIFLAICIFPALPGWADKQWIESYSVFMENDSEVEILKHYGTLRNMYLNQIRFLKKDKSNRLHAKKEILIKGEYTELSGQRTYRENTKNLKIIPEYSQEFGKITAWKLFINESIDHKLLLAGSANNEVKDKEDNKLNPILNGRNHFALGQKPKLSINFDENAIENCHISLKTVREGSDESYELLNTQPILLASSTKIKLPKRNILYLIKRELGIAKPGWVLVEKSEEKAFYQTTINKNIPITSSLSISFPPNTDIENIAFHLDKNNFSMRKRIVNYSDLTFRKIINSDNSVTLYLNFQTFLKKNKNLLISKNHFKIKTIFARLKKADVSQDKDISTNLHDYFNPPIILAFATEIETVRKQTSNSLVVSLGNIPKSILLNLPNNFLKLTLKPKPQSICLVTPVEASIYSLNTQTIGKHLSANSVWLDDPVSDKYLQKTTSEIIWAKINFWLPFYSHFCENHIKLNDQEIYPSSLLNITPNQEHFKELYKKSIYCFDQNNSKIYSVEMQSKSLVSTILKIPKTKVSSKSYFRINGNVTKAPKDQIHAKALFRFKDNTEWLTYFNFNEARIFDKQYENKTIKSLEISLISMKELKFNITLKDFVIFQTDSVANKNTFAKPIPATGFIELIRSNTNPQYTTDINSSTAHSTIKWPLDHIRGFSFKFSRLDVLQRCFLKINLHYTVSSDPVFANKPKIKSFQFCGDNIQGNYFISTHDLFGHLKKGSTLNFITWEFKSGETLKFSSSMAIINFPSIKYQLEHGLQIAYGQVKKTLNFINTYQNDFLWTGQFETQLPLAALGDLSLNNLYSSTGFLDIQNVLVRDNKSIMNKDTNTFNPVNFIGTNSEPTDLTLKQIFLYVISTISIIAISLYLALRRNFNFRFQSLLENKYNVFIYKNDLLRLLYLASITVFIFSVSLFTFDKFNRFVAIGTLLMLFIAGLCFTASEKKFLQLINMSIPILERIKLLWRDTIIILFVGTILANTLQLRNIGEIFATGVFICLLISIFSTHISPIYQSSEKKSK